MLLRAPDKTPEQHYLMSLRFMRRQADSAHATSAPTLLPWHDKCARDSARRRHRRRCYGGVHSSTTHPVGGNDACYQPTIVTTWARSAAAVHRDYFAKIIENNNRCQAFLYQCWCSTHLTLMSRCHHPDAHHNSFGRISGDLKEEKTF